MNFHKCNMHFTTICAGIALLFFGLNTSFSQQNDDSLLLQKVENIEVSLNSIDSSDEDLYDNPVSFQTFYDDLSDDGEWIMITKEEIEDELNDGDGQGFASASYLLTSDRTRRWSTRIHRGRAGRRSFR